MTVHQLRVVVTAEDYDEALAFYRDALGLTEEAAYASPDGRVTIPNARPGQTIIVQLDESAGPDFLTLRTARTDEERAAVVADIKRMSRRLRELLNDDLPVDPSELYGEDGLPA